MKKQERKKENGITLVALVVTIIVLLILAGVTIATLTGDNGILTRAQEAKEKTKKSKDFEQLQSCILGSYDINGNIKLENLKNLFDNEKISYNQIDSFPIEVSLDNSSYLITKYGNIIDSSLNKYNKNGLMVYLDATNNTYNGHDNHTPIWYDLSGNCNNATLSGFEFNSSSGWEENSLKVRGNISDDVVSQEFLEIPYKLNENDSFSIELVFKDNDNCRTTYLSSNNGWHTFRFHDYQNSEGIYDGSFYIGGNIYTNFNNRFSPNDTNYFLQNNNIYYVAYTFDSQTNLATLYINGIENKYSKEYIGKNEPCESFVINTLEEDGTKSGSATYYQIRFYNRVLKEDDIITNFNIDNEKYHINTK